MRAPNVTDSQHLLCRRERETAVSGPAPRIPRAELRSVLRRGSADHAEFIVGPAKGWGWRTRLTTLRPTGNVRAPRIVNSYLFRFLAPFVALAFMGVEQPFTQADRFGGHFHQFVVLDVGKRLLKRHADRRG
jgi:hypothetical protein